MPLSDTLVLLLSNVVHSFGNSRDLAGGSESGNADTVDALAGVGPLDIEFEAGTLVSIVGPNGSGKSTVGRLACGMLHPDAGTVSLRHTVRGDADADEAARRTEDASENGDDSAGSLRRYVGMVQQDPLDQIVTSLAYDEIAFGPRNLGLEEEAVAGRVRQAIALVGLDDSIAQRRCEDLSGGEQQRLAIAGVLAMRPSFIVFDEASSHLDASLRPQIRDLIRSLVRDQGVGVIQITHDPAEYLDGDRVIVIDRGRVRADLPPAEFVRSDVGRRMLERQDDPYASAVLTACKDGFELSGYPDPDHLLSWLQTRPELADAVLRGLEGRTGRSFMDCGHGLCALRFRNVAFSYGALPVLRDIDLEVHAGEVALLAGRSGSGKSTLASLAAGLLEPDSGSVEIDREGVLARPKPGDVAMAMQRPEAQFFLDTVYEEIGFAATNAGATESETETRVITATQELEIPDRLFDLSPFELSGGEARRVAIASVAYLSASVCILDEPTAGLDAEARMALKACVRRLADSGRAVLVISHDIDEWLSVADRVALVANGGVSGVWSAAEARRNPGIYRASGLTAPSSVELFSGLAGGACEDAGAGDVSSGSARVDADEREDASDSARSVLQNVDARAKLVGMICLSIAIVGAESPLALLVGYAALAVGFVLSSMRISGVAPMLKALSVLAVLTLAGSLVRCDGAGQIGIIGPIGVDPQGAVRGIIALLRIVLLVGFAAVVVRTTSAEEVVGGVMRLLRPLDALGVSVARLGDALALALRFIPIVGDEIMRIRMAQRVRGVRFDEGGIAQRLGRWVSVLSPLLVGLMRRADRLGASMDARCYGMRGKSCLPEARRLAASDKLVMLSCLAVAAVILLLGR